MTTNDAEELLFAGLARGRGRPVARCPQCTDWAQAILVRLVSVEAVEGFEGKDARIDLCCNAGHPFKWLIKSHEDSVFIGPDE
jgi:hypothetical protein